MEPNISLTPGVVLKQCVPSDDDPNMVKGPAGNNCRWIATNTSEKFYCVWLHPNLLLGINPRRSAFSLTMLCNTVCERVDYRKCPTVGYTPQKHSNARSLALDRCLTSPSAVFGSYLSRPGFSIEIEPAQNERATGAYGNAAGDEKQQELLSVSMRQTSSLTRPLIQLARYFVLPFPLIRTTRRTEQNIPYKSRFHIEHQTSSQSSLQPPNNQPRKRNNPSRHPKSALNILPLPCPRNSKNQTPKSKEHTSHSPDF
jgi:hypothetical protein